MITKLERHDGMNITDIQWNEYCYLFDLINVEKRNPKLQGYHIAFSGLAQLCVGLCVGEIAPNPCYKLAADY